MTALSYFRSMISFQPFLIDPFACAAGFVLLGPTIDRIFAACLIPNRFCDLGESSPSPWSFAVALKYDGSSRSIQRGDRPAIKLMSPMSRQPSCARLQLNTMPRNSIRALLRPASLTTSVPPPGLAARAISPSVSLMVRTRKPLIRYCRTSPVHARLMPQQLFPTCRSRSRRDSSFSGRRAWP